MLSIERERGPHIRIAPTTSMFNYSAWDDHVGELVQSFYRVGADDGASIEFDAHEHQRPGEAHAGATPLEALHVFIEALAARQAWRLADRLLDAIVAWVTKHRGESAEEVCVTIYGPDGEAIKSVLVDPDGQMRDWPPPRL